MIFHDGLNLILLLCGLFVFYRIIKGTQQLEFWHLISVTSADGRLSLIVSVERESNRSPILSRK